MTVKKHEEKDLLLLMLLFAIRKKDTFEYLLDDAFHRSCPFGAILNCQETAQNFLQVA